MRRRGNPAKRWLSFLVNHREVIVACDFFTVPTLTFQLLYCFFVIEHGRRRILHFNVTRRPTVEWVMQQLREAFPEAGPVAADSCIIPKRSGRIIRAFPLNKAQLWPEFLLRRSVCSNAL